MNADNYQKLAARTLIEKPDFRLSPQEEMILWNAMGVAGEAGEVTDLVKKQVFHRHGIDAVKVGKELGDLLWYVAGLCTVLGLSMADVMQANIDKLKARYPDGYDKVRNTDEAKAKERTDGGK